MRWEKQHGKHSKMLRKTFLGNLKAENYHEIVSDLLTAYKAIRCSTSLKVHFLGSHQTSSLRILAPPVTSTKREISSGYFQHGNAVPGQIGASVCWMTTAGPSKEMFHRRHKAENQPQLLFR
jgi:hypothetical protein